MSEKQPSDHDLLVRIDEQTKSIKNDLNDLKKTVYGEKGLKVRMQRMESIAPVVYAIGLVIIFFTELYTAFKK